MALVPGLKVSILCHSEGNYMMMLGMYQLTCVKVDQIILFAADINNAALQYPPSGLTGQGSYIVPNANRVTTYYSANDDTLADSIAAYQWLGYHNPIVSTLGLNLLAIASASPGRPTTTAPSSPTASASTAHWW